MADNTFLAPLSPIQRSTPSQNLISFQKNETSIYNKYSPYYQAGGDLGADQPYIYTKLTDSSTKKNLTRYDTQSLPAGSLARDVQRLSKFTASKRGALFIGKQILIQGQAAFDETRTYNVGSVIGSSGGSTVGSILSAILPIEKSSGITRHIEGGGLLNFFASSLLSTIGIKSNFANTTGTIPGTATSQLPTHVQISGGGRYGLMRGETASGGRANFDKVWIGAGKPAGNGGFLQSILKSVASTTGLFSNSGKRADWQYRPEYGSRFKDDDAYAKMYFDVKKKLSYTGKLALFQDNTQGISDGQFYNDINEAPDLKTLKTTVEVKNVMKTYAPLFLESDGSGVDPSYASKRRVTDRYTELEKSGLQELYKRMFSALSPSRDVKLHPMYNKSAERYDQNENAAVGAKNNYKTIPDNKTENPYSQSTSFAEFEWMKLDKKGFAKSGKEVALDRFRTELKPGDKDTYNSLDVIVGSKENIPSEIQYPTNQSADIIFFYFYDLVNKTYIPFRATLGSISDQHSPEWEDIKYIGRADKLFIYKGFSREVSFSFKVYANSVDELIPMWKRINYLTGLVRPSKYTAKAIVTNESVDSQETTGAESGFIYPPMIEFRIGDMYVDQPGILRSVSITIPEDASWETLRGDKYEYLYGLGKTVSKDVKSRQLPTIVDISIQLSVIERQQSVTGINVFGPMKGWDQL